MPRRKENQQGSIQESFRWPKLFERAELAGLLFLAEAWPKLVEDCCNRAENLKFKVVHNIPTTKEAEAEQNFQRGQIAAFEDFIGLEQELKEWRNRQ